MGLRRRSQLRKEGIRINTNEETIGVIYQEIARYIGN
jgi:hypothetical protein